jgi:epoxyqueuosine reductase
MLWEMLEQIRKIFGEVNGRAFVDSAPVLERVWAAKSGLGWIGKNGLLINPKFGSYTFIGELILDIDIEPSKNTVPNRCGTCTRCIDSCPTGAIVAHGIVDARKCISYLTIEKKSELTDDEKSQLNDWCFGCDICQEACPWNAKISISNHDVVKPKSDVLTFNSKKAKELNEKEFKQLFSDTPVARSGFKRFMKNSQASSI